MFVRLSLTQLHEQTREKTKNVREPVLMRTKCPHFLRTNGSQYEPKRQIFDLTCVWACVFFIIWSNCGFNCLHPNYWAFWSKMSTFFVKIVRVLGSQVRTFSHVCSWYLLITLDTNSYSWLHYIHHATSWYLLLSYYFFDM